MARKVVEEIRRSGPSRVVKSGRGSVSGRYPSRKMGVAVQFESHRNELAYILELEHDPDVLEYHDQPPSIPLGYLSATGKRVLADHTADFFVVSRAFTGWVECKTAARLERLSVDQPNRFQLRSLGEWHCPPGEAHAAQLGLGYRVRSSEETDPILASNLRFLDDYLRPDELTVHQVLIDLVLSFVLARPGLPLSEILSFLAARGLPADGLYTMILTGHLFVDLTKSRLTEPELVPLFPDAKTAAGYPSSGIQPGGVRIPLLPGEVILWDGRPLTLINRGEHLNWFRQADGNLVTLSDDDIVGLVAGGGMVVTRRAQTERARDEIIRERLATADPAALGEANRRHKAISDTASEIPTRTLRRWRESYRRAEEKTGIGFLGLIPNLSRSGNRTARLPPRSSELAGEFIREYFDNPRQPNRHSVWSRLVEACARESLVAPTYKTFRRMLLKRPVVEQTAARRGPRAAYQVQAADTIHLDIQAPRHGDRPFEIAHIDHTRLDIALVCSVTGKPLGHPWMTLLTDAFSRRFLAIGLTYDPPSYRACMGILRECVRRFQRLPGILMTDGGKEFQSQYYEALLAAYEVTKKIRPPSESRFGSICERLFGTTNTMFIHTLVGNTQLSVENLRLATGKFAPRRQAAWTLEALHPLLEKFAYETYDGIDHPALGQTPAEAFTQGMANFGQREFRIVPNDTNFLMMTMPTTPTGQATVVQGRGIKINRIFYWSIQFGRQELRGKKLKVRYDPEDAGRAWSFIDGHWVECRSQYYSVFHHRSEREIQLATAELRKRLAAQDGKVQITALKLANFLREVDAAEVGLLAEQRSKAAANLKLRTTRTEPRQKTEQTEPASIGETARTGLSRRIVPKELDILEPLE